MRDQLRRKARVGDHIVHAKRRANQLWLRHATIVELGSGRISVVLDKSHPNDPYQPGERYYIHNDNFLICLSESV